LHNENSYLNVGVFYVWWPTDYDFELGQHILFM